VTSLPAAIPTCDSTVINEQDVEEDHANNFYCISESGIYGLHNRSSKKYKSKINDESTYVFEIEKTRDENGYIKLTTKLVNVAASVISKPEISAIYTCYNNICGQTYGYVKDFKGNYYEFSPVTGGKLLKDDDFVECNKEEDIGKMYRNAPDHQFSLCLDKSNDEVTGDPIYAKAFEYSSLEDQKAKNYVMPNRIGNIFSNNQDENVSDKYIVVKVDETSFTHINLKEDEYCIGKDMEITETYYDVCNGNDSSCIKTYNCRSNGLCLNTTNSNIICKRGTCDPTTSTNCDEGYYYYYVPYGSNNGIHYCSKENGESVTCQRLTRRLGLFLNNQSILDTNARPYIYSTMSGRDTYTPSSNTCENSYGEIIKDEKNNIFKFCIDKNDENAITLSSDTQESLMLKLEKIDSISTNLFYKLLTFNSDEFYVIVDIIGKSVMIRPQENVKYRFTKNGKLFEKESRYNICLTGELESITEYVLDQCTADYIDYYKIRNRGGN